MMKNKLYTFLWTLLANFSLNLIAENSHTAFIPGFSASPGVIKHYQNAFANPDNCSEINTFPDQAKPKNISNKMLGTVCEYFGKKNINRESYMGQTYDVIALNKHIKKHNANILYGSCKGASTIINAMAENHENSNVQALVLEGCIADLLLAVDSKSAHVGIPSSWNGFLWRLCFPNYPQKPIAPIQAISNITNKNLAILLLHSQKDKTAPFAQHALLLYKTFKEAGFNNIFLAEIQGDHCTGIKQDPIKYLQIVHSFYKKIDLPYNSEFATLNMDQFNQHSIENITEKIKAHQNNLDTIRMKAQKKLLITVTLSCLAIAMKKLYIPLRFAH